MELQGMTPITVVPRAGHNHRPTVQEFPADSNLQQALNQLAWSAHVLPPWTFTVRKKWGNILCLDDHQRLLEEEPLWVKFGPLRAEELPFRERLDTLEQAVAGFARVTLIPRIQELAAEVLYHAFISDSGHKFSDLTSQGNDGEMDGGKQGMGMSTDSRAGEGGSCQLAATHEGVKKVAERSRLPQRWQPSSMMCQSANMPASSSLVSKTWTKVWPGS
jgi:hypothetical protein